ncbi:MAG: DUF3108 domain-containing protein [Deltaproteobacteria bacterium]|nr:MAG: DUF3108 domain-containing protein [Deltaproteobacteria bacterium]
MRRAILMLFIACPLLAGVVGAALPLPGTVLAPRPPAAMAGEEQCFTLDFLVFKDLAEGRLRLTAEPVPGRYRAELVARTLGVASWLTGDRIQRYVAVMEEDGPGRLRSVNYESAIEKRSHGELKDRRKRYRFDYRAGKVYQEKGENGSFSPGPVFELPSAGGRPVDILTGFYNLRAGAYGPLTPGALIRIPTFTTRGMTEIEVEVLAAAARAAQPFFPATGTLLRVRVDPEIFETGDSELYAWFDESGRPAAGLVENVIGLGHVYGRLRKEQ